MNQDEGIQFCEARANVNYGNIQFANFDKVKYFQQEGSEDEEDREEDEDEENGIEDSEFDRTFVLRALG